MNIGAARPERSWTNLRRSSKRLNHWRRDCPLALPNGGRHLPGAAVLAAVERLPRVDPLVLPTPQGRGRLRRRHVGLRWMLVHGAQGRPFGVQPLLQEAAQSQPLPTPHRHPQGRAAEGYGELVKVSVLREPNHPRKFYFL